MTTAQFSPVSWSEGDPLDNQKLAKMASNEQYLAEQMPKMYYNAFGVKKTTGVKVMAFTATFGTNKAHKATTDVYFGNFFSPGCVPVITVGNNTYPQTRFHVEYRGLSATRVDHRGMKLSIATDEVTRNYAPITNSVVITIIAMGW